MRKETPMVMFHLLGILFFPSIIADEMKIYENGSVHWIRDWTMEEKNVTLEGIGGRFGGKNDTTKELVGVNTEMKYIVDSPLKTTIGKLEKEIKIEGCQHIGCNIILRFGDGTVFYKQGINKSNDKIIIDLGSGQSQ